MFQPSKTAGGLPDLTPGVAAILVCLLFALIDWAQGYPGLAWAGDNDSMLRMVEVRDLMNGQGWFDLTQYRMGPDGGFVMHWSRLVDAPIAGLALLFGERMALILWPLALLGLATLFIARSARALAGDAAILPAAFLTLATLWTVRQFDAGSIDHHNVQFVLTVATLSFLLDSARQPALALAAGMATGLSIGVGMEAAPYVAISGLVPATWFLLVGRKAAFPAMWYGLGFAGVAALIHLVTIGFSWGQVRCDAFSLPHLVMSAIAGLGLAVAAFTGRNVSFAMRAGLLIATGVVAVTAIVAFFPQCIAAPYSDLDPRQNILWLDNVSETMPFWTVMQLRPAYAMGLYATPAIGVCFCLWMILVRRERILSWALVAAFLIAATTVAVWQIRGSIFALGLATIPLSAWVASWRGLAAADAPGARVRLGLAVLLSMNMTWSAGAEEVVRIGGAAPATDNLARGDAHCHSESAYRPIFSLPATKVLSDVSGGSSILVFSHHRVLTGPYHRNPGNLIAYDIQMAQPDDARQFLRQHGVGLITQCDSDEAPALTRKNPSSLHARLARKDPPSWLEIVPGTEQGPLRAWRVVEGQN